MAQGSLNTERVTRTDFREKRDERDTQADKRRQERRQERRVAHKTRRAATAEARG